MMKVDKLRSLISTSAIALYACIAKYGFQFYKSVCESIIRRCSCDKQTHFVGTSVY